MGEGEQIARQLATAIEELDAQSRQNLTTSALSVAIWLAQHGKHLQALAAPRTLVVPDVRFGGNIATQTLAFIDDLATYGRNSIVIGVMRGPGSRRVPGSSREFSFFGINELVKVEVSSGDGVSEILDQNGRVLRGAVLIAVLEINQVNNRSSDGVDIIAIDEAWVKVTSAGILVSRSAQID